MQDAWVAFARTGRPGWVSEKVREFRVAADGGVADLDGLRDDDCDFWDSV